MREKIVIVGAGSAMFTQGLVADLLMSGIEADIALVDTDSDALEVAAKLTAKTVVARNANVGIEQSTELADVLPGATIVVVTIGVGGRRAWEQDVLIPRQYGIYQPVGDTIMPGGISRGMRMVPALIEIAAKVAEFAPNALFFNYSNPMAINCTALYFADLVPAIGLCHGVPHSHRYLADALGVKNDELSFLYAGINHLTWFYDLKINGEDATEQLLECARQKLSRPRQSGDLGGDFAEKGDDFDNFDADRQQFTWELTARSGNFPAVMDRHITEFFPELFKRKKAYYGLTLGLEAYSFEDTIRNGDEIFAQMRDNAFSDRSLPDFYFNRQAGEHEQLIEIIDSIRHNRGKVFAVNLPNLGQVRNLPRDVVIESPAVLDAQGVHPLNLGDMPDFGAATLAKVMEVVKISAQAALLSDRELFIDALFLEGSAGTLETAEKLADKLLEAQKAYLPDNLFNK